MRKTSINREILALAIPNILSNLSVPLLSTVDTLLMGRLSVLHIGAVGVGSMIFNFIYWNFGFLRMGTTGMAAQAYGASNSPAVIHTLGRAVLLALLLGGLIWLLQGPLGRLGFYLMNVDGDQYELVQTYFNVRIWAAPATLALYALMGWFFGMQNAIYPLILTIFINLVNIVLSYWLVWVKGMEVAGVAWGTVLAQYAGLALAVGLFFFKYRHLLGHFQRQALWAIEAFGHFLRVNWDIFLRTLCLTFVFGFFYSRSSAAGATILAINTILQQFISWMSFAVDGFAFASESLVGKYKGARDAVRLQASIHYSFVWGMGLALLFSLVFWVYGEALMWVFTDEGPLVADSLDYMIWVILFPIIGTPCYVWDGIFIGLTASRAMRDSMVLSFAVFLGAYFALSASYGNHGLWAALLIFMAARGLFQWWWYVRKGSFGMD
ncbi:MAG: MATE family efflux transporter [Bacteroidota bacterium]